VTNGWMTDELESICKKGSRCLIDMLLQHFPGIIKGNHKKPQDRRPARDSNEARVGRIIPKKSFLIAHLTAAICTGNLNFMGIPVDIQREIAFFV
jgi:hypothetical protein